MSEHEDDKGPKPWGREIADAIVARLVKEGVKIVDLLEHITDAPPYAKVGMRTLELHGGMEWVEPPADAATAKAVIDRAEWRAGAAPSLAAHTRTARSARRCRCCGW